MPQIPRPPDDASRRPSRAPAGGPDGTREVADIADLRPAVNACHRCELWRLGTQGVPGEGPAQSALMLVGEAPGDSEDVAGHPFVGPAGAVLDRALEDAGVERSDLFVTNAVKHFKFELRGRRRLHVKPAVGEIKACHWWLLEEIRLVQPRLVVALGATAARSLLGRVVTVASLRGSPMPLPDGPHVLVTVHPSFLLRVPDEAQRQSEYLRFVGDLRAAQRWLAQ